MPIAMRVTIRSFSLLFALEVFASGANAQFLWRPVHSDQDDTAQFRFSAISCSGNNCTAGMISSNKSDYSFSYFLLESTDAGETWEIQSPNIDFPYIFANSGFTQIQRIDSLNI